MNTELIILGSGNSTGIPRIDGYWGKCNKKNKKNNRTRCSAIILKGKNSVLIDTSPDIRYQLSQNKIKNISSVLYTHEHSDQTNGLFELRPFYWIYNKKINIYGNLKTISSLKKADGLVIGSQLCKGITDSIKNRQNPVTKLNKMVNSLKRRFI